MSARDEGAPALSRRITGWIGGVLLGLFTLLMLVPLYLVIVNSFKPESVIRERPFAADPSEFSIDYLLAALASPAYNVVSAFGVTLLFVVLVNILSLVLAGPAAYVIARGTRVWHKLLFLLFLAGLFIPTQVLVIPVIYVLRYTGLMGTVPGFVLYETTLTLPVSMFLYVGYIKSIPRELDQAAQIDGAGRLRTFWKVVFPLMKPVVATAVILHTIGVWNDFVNPQIVLGPASGLHTVMTGVYAAIGLETTELSVVYPTLLLAIAPVLIFFVIMQRKIVGGLTAGATKG